MRKATNEQILAAYQSTGSVHRAGKLLGMCGGSVHERLVRMGRVNKQRRLRDSEKLEIQSLYAAGFLVGDGQLRALAIRLGRTVPFIVRYAGGLEVTNRSRSLSSAAASRLCCGRDIALSTHGHPRGMAGKRHSRATREVIGEASKAQARATTQAEWRARSLKMQRTNMLRYGRTSSNLSPHGNWRQGWRTIGGVRKFYRSRWEANYARYLESCRSRGEIRSWEHEAEAFWFECKRGPVSYLPDFRVTGIDGDVSYHEVKGWMDARSQAQMRRMGRYYPGIRLVVIDGVWFRSNRGLSETISGWESQ